MEKIQALEAQRRQYVYNVAKKRLASGLPQATGGPLMMDALGSQADNQETNSEMGDDNVLLSDLIDERGGDLNPDENLLEIWVKHATVREGLLTPGSSSFVVVDFFDYESQTTGLLTGNKPAWDFAATFKLVVDDFLLRYLATDVITLELNMACQGDPPALAYHTYPPSNQYHPTILSLYPPSNEYRHPKTLVAIGNLTDPPALAYHTYSPSNEHRPSIPLTPLSLSAIQATSPCWHDAVFLCLICYVRNPSYAWSITPCSRYDPKRLSLT